MALEFKIKPCTIDEAAMNVLFTDAGVVGDAVVKLIKDRQRTSFSDPDGTRWGSTRPYTPKYALWKADIKMSGFMKKYKERRGKEYKGKRVRNPITGKMEWALQTRYYGAVDVDAEVKKAKEAGNAKAEKALANVPRSLRDQVNLRLTGTMRNEIAVTGTSTENGGPEVTVGFSTDDSAKVAAAQHIKYKRPFFRLGRRAVGGKSELVRTYEYVRARVRRAIQKVFPNQKTPPEPEKLI